MSMLDVARYLSYSRSIDHTSNRERILNLSMANSGRLFSCLDSNRSHGSFGREQDKQDQFPKIEKGI